MSQTRKLPTDGMQRYFDDFSRRFLMNESTDVADVEELGMDLGDQVANEGVHLVGISYDPHTRALEVELETGDHRTYQPKEVWVVEESDGFVRALEIVRDDGTKEIVRVRRLGLRRVD
jgi:Family of unknown function (DUF5335)